jgi:hypothetical protein
MKNNRDIEKILKESRLPDRDMSSTGHEVWTRIIESRKKRGKRSPFSRMKPWVWALASILLILLCVLFMVLLVSVR